MKKYKIGGGNYPVLCEQLREKYKDFASMPDESKQDYFGNCLMKSLHDGQLREWRDFFSLTSLYRVTD